MSKVMTNSALNVKVHGKLKNRITDDMYVRMTNLKSVPALALFLKEETIWGKLLKDVDTKSIHRGFLEQLLSRGINRDIKELASFTDISVSAFMRLFSVREEIDNIKVFLRLLFLGHPERYQAPPVSFGKSRIDFSKLENVKTLEEFIGIIDKTIYALPLKGFLGYEGKHGIFDIETVLDGFYTDMVFRFAQKYLSVKEYNIVKEVYGTEIDLSTIMYIIRFKNFDIPKEQIYPYIRHKYAHLNDNLISRMIDAKSEDKVLEILNETKYKRIFKEGNGSFEKRIEEYLKKLHRKMFKRAGYTVEAVLYYAKIREIELRNIITIIEGIRYSSEPEMIQRYLIGFKSGEGVIV